MDRIPIDKLKTYGLIVIVHLNFLAIQFIWGAFAVTSKYALSEEFVPPLLFSSLRFLTALPFMFISALIESKSLYKLIPQKKTHWLQYITIGFFGVSLTQQIYIYGLDFTTASNAAVLGCLSPAWTMVFSLFCKRERFIWLKLIGILLCILGALVIINPTNLEFTMGALGDVLVILMTILFGLYIVYSDYLTELTGNSQQVAFWSFFFGTIFVCLSSVIIHPEEWLEIHNLPWNAWWPILYAGIFATAFCYGMMNWCLKRSTPITAMAYEPFQPLTAAFLAYFLLDEELTVFYVVGFFIVVFGLFFVLGGRYREIQLEKRENEKFDYTVDYVEDY